MSEKVRKEHLPPTESPLEGTDLGKLPRRPETEDEEDRHVLFLYRQTVNGVYEIRSFEDQHTGLEFVEIFDPKTKEVLLSEEFALFRSRLEESGQKDIQALDELLEDGEFKDH